MSSSEQQEVAAASPSGPTTRSTSLVVSAVQNLVSPTHTLTQVTTPPSSKRKRSSLDIRSLQAASFPQGQAPSNVYRVGFVGAGNMARAIAEGMIASGVSMRNIFLASVMNVNITLGQVSRSSITVSATSNASENLRKMKVFNNNIKVQ